MTQIEFNFDIANLTVCQNIKIILDDYSRINKQYDKFAINYWKFNSRILTIPAGCTHSIPEELSSFSSRLPRQRSATRLQIPFQPIDTTLNFLTETLLPSSHRVIVDFAINLSHGGTWVAAFRWAFEEQDSRPVFGSESKMWRVDALACVATARFTSRIMNDCKMCARVYYSRIADTRALARYYAGGPRRNAAHFIESYNANFNRSTGSRAYCRVHTRLYTLYRP